MNKNINEDEIRELSCLARYRDIQSVKRSINKSNVTTLREKQSFLHAALSNDTGDRDNIAFFLIDLGVDVNAQGSRGYTALHQCAAHGAYDVAQYILEHGGKPSLNLSDQYGNQPLWTAVFNSNAESGMKITDLFLQYEADIHHKNNVNLSPLDLALDVQDEGVLALFKKNRPGEVN